MWVVIRESWSSFAERDLTEEDFKRFKKITWLDEKTDRQVSSNAWAVDKLLSNNDNKNSIYY